MATAIKCDCSAGTARRLPKGRSRRSTSRTLRLSSPQRKPNLDHYEAPWARLRPQGARQLGSRGHPEWPGGAGLEEVAKTLGKRARPAGRGPRPARSQSTSSWMRPAGRLPVNTAQLGPSRHYQWHLADRARPKGPCGLGGTGRWPTQQLSLPGPAAVSLADAPGSWPHSADSPHPVHADQHRRTRR
jgi:hypothetical protein